MKSITIDHQITTILFDVGGVLLMDFVENKIIDLAKKYNISPDLLIKAKEKFRPPADTGQISDPEFWIKALEYCNVKATAEDWKLDEYMEEVDGGIEIAKTLKKNGYRIAILSNDSHEMSRQRRNKYGFDDLFHNIYISCNYGVAKPDLKIYKIALSELNAQPEQCVFIDDRLENIESSQQLGIHSILFINANQVKNDLKDLGLELK